MARPPVADLVAASADELGITDPPADRAAVTLAALAHATRDQSTWGGLRYWDQLAARVLLATYRADDLPGWWEQMCRQMGCDVFWEALGRPELPAPIFDLLWSGGALAKAGAGHVLTARQLVEVRERVPMVSLFGGSGAGRIIEGKLRVLKLTPVVAETAHILPAGVLADGEEPPPARQLLQVEEFSRRDDAKRPALAAAIEGMRQLPAPSDGTLLPDTTDDPVGLERIMQMRYGVETLAAGTRLHWGMQVRHGTDAEVALLARGIDSWLSDGGHVGGRSATGHGRLRLDVHQWQTVTPSTTVGEALAVTGRDDLAEHVAAHRDEILETLSWFS